MTPSDLQKELRPARGVVVGPTPADEAEHFMKCRECGGWLDMRDLGDVLAHEGPHVAATVS